jgi:hypothetical protein
VEHVQETVKPIAQDLIKIAQGILQKAWYMTDLAILDKYM